VERSGHDTRQAHHSRAQLYLVAEDGKGLAVRVAKQQVTIQLRDEVSELAQFALFVEDQAVMVSGLRAAEVEEGPKLRRDGVDRARTDALCPHGGGQALALAQATLGDVERRRLRLRLHELTGKLLRRGEVFFEELRRRRAAHADGRQDRRVVARSGEHPGRHGEEGQHERSQSQVMTQNSDRAL
jgi:hypothetical protein